MISIYSAIITALVFAQSFGQEFLPNESGEPGLASRKKLTEPGALNKRQMETDNISINQESENRNFQAIKILKISDDINAVFRIEQTNILDVYISTIEDEENDVLKDFYKKYEEFKGEECDFDLKIKRYPFSFGVFRKDQEEPIFSTEGTPIKIMKNYREFSTKLPTDRVFGLGERNNPNFKLKPGRYTIFNRDELGKVWDGGTGKQTYGSHPMYLVQEFSGNYSVVFVQNSYPMEIELYDLNLRFMIVGGPIHIKIFLGDSYPETAIRMYHDYINGSTTPPFWALGFHQSRYGYKSASRLRDVVETYRSYSIPIDVIWSDIDYMVNYQVFTVNENFNYLEIEDIKKTYGVKYVPIIDPGVGVIQTDSFPYAEGVKDDIFLRSPRDGKYYLGKVWPGWVHFVDYLHPLAYSYTQKMLIEFQRTLPFDGIWLDMNEISNFCQSQDDCPRENANHFDQETKAMFITPEIEMDFWPGSGNVKESSLPLNMKHHGGKNELQIHNLNCYFECTQTYNILKQDFKKKLPFILTRATFPGSGAVAFHWTGDNLSNNDFMKISIPSIFNFNLFGIPFTGSDICGFMGDVTPELCARWVQLGSFYPFSRNHNHVSARDQEFYVFGNPLLDAARNSLKLRYSLLKHLYSIFLRNNGKGTFFRPIFFEYPDDVFAYDTQTINEQFMIGSSLMATPVLENEKTNTTAYFPSDSWIHVETGFVVKSESDQQKSITIKSLLNESLPLFLRGGFAVAWQPTNLVLKSADLSNEYQIKASLSKKKAQLHQSEEANLIAISEGELLGVNDLSEDNVQYKCLESNTCLVKFKLKLLKNKGKCSLSLEFNREDPKRQTYLETIYLNKIHISNFPLNTSCRLVINETRSCKYSFEGAEAKTERCYLIETKQADLILYGISHNLMFGRSIGFN